MLQPVAVLQGMLEPVAVLQGMLQPVAVLQGAPLGAAVPQALRADAERGMLQRVEPAQALRGEQEAPRDVGVQRHRLLQPLAVAADAAEAPAGRPRDQRAQPRRAS